MKKISIVGVVLCLASVIIVCILVAGCCCPWKNHGNESCKMKKAAMAQSVYVCPDCHTMTLKAGSCAMCKKDLQQMHLLGTKDGQAMVCACGSGCKCDAKGMKDSKCACGKDVMSVSAKGMYDCCMGCPDMSDNPGKCACGMDMQKCE